MSKEMGEGAGGRKGGRRMRRCKKRKKERKTKKRERERLGVRKRGNEEKERRVSDPEVRAREPLH